MCISVFSPGNEIQLDYVVETIVLYKKGSSKVLIDILLRNNSDNDVSSLNILFPHRLTKICRKGDEHFVQTSGKFADITWSFLEKTSNYNTLYHQPGSKIEHQEKGTNASLKVSIPDPANPVKNKTYEGDIAGSSKLKIFDGLNILQQKILIDLDLAYLICELEIPIVKNQPRWLRLELSPETSAKDKMNSLEYLWRSWTTDVKFRYDILSPYTMIERFTKKTGCYFQECAANHPELALNVQSLVSIIAKKGFNKKNTKTLCPDWKINLFPFHFEDIENIVVNGDILTCGTSPNYIDYYQNETVAPKRDYLNGEYCYQWKAGPENVKIENDGKFTISFVAKYNGTFKRAIPIISILLAILSLILTLFF